MKEDKSIYEILYLEQKSIADAYHKACNEYRELLKDKGRESQMDTYIVKVKDDELRIEADDVSWDLYGLKFHSQGEIVAMFLNWDYWIEIKK